MSDPRLELIIEKGTLAASQALDRLNYYEGTQRRDEVIASSIRTAVAEASEQPRRAPTRLESAENAVIEAAFELWSSAATLDPTFQRIFEACSRLRDLREQAALVHDTALDNVQPCSNPISIRDAARWTTAREHTARCHLPEGHDEVHEGTLTIWWER